MQNQMGMEVEIGMGTGQAARLPTPNGAQDLCNCEAARFGAANESNWEDICMQSGP